MSTPFGSAQDVDEFVRRAGDDADNFARTARYFESDPEGREMEEWATHGGEMAFLGLVSAPEFAVEVADYYGTVDASNSCWMDNTTILTASRLMADSDAPEFVTPMTLWDLATFTRAAVCFERIYHHSHHEVDSIEINRLLGSQVLHDLPVPHRPTTQFRNEDERGMAFRFTSIWNAAHRRLHDLSDAVGTETLDGVELRALTSGWSDVLGCTVSPSDVVDYRSLSTEFRSPSNILMQQMVAADTLPGALPPDHAGLIEVANLRNLNHPGLKMLSEINLRSYMNQRFADDLALPYVRGTARMPFRRHLDQLAQEVQLRLVSAELLDKRYAELAEGAQLQLPVFLALALQQADQPSDLWTRIASLRLDSRRYRERRHHLDQVLADRDLGEYKKMAKALSTDAESIATLVGGPLAAAAESVFSTVVQGTPDVVGTSIAALTAAGKNLLSSTLVDRIRWRLNRPDLHFMNSAVDQAKHLTEAMPRVSRVWKVPERHHDLFANRFAGIGSAWSGRR
jgi:hypothetical protein